METLYDPSFAIPLPQPLPTELTELRDNSNLMEDVWITPSPQDVPRWLGDTNVREGIKAMQKVDRCIEEERRLEIEADNLCRWWGREIASVELALRDPKSVLPTIIYSRSLTKSLMTSQMHLSLFYWSKGARICCR